MDHVDAAAGDMDARWARHGALISKLRSQAPRRSINNLQAMTRTICPPRPFGSGQISPRRNPGTELTPSPLRPYSVPTPSPVTIGLMVYIFGKDT